MSKKDNNDTGTWADEYVKPSRQRDRKHDHAGSKKPSGRRSENEEMARARKRYIEEERLSESSYRGGYWAEDEFGFFWVESEEDSSDTGEV